MNYRKLGKTGLVVSEIGFGSWAISGKAYGKTDDTESIKTLNEALENGVTFIDTADSYGNGHCEELIGKVLSERKDKDTIVATKFGWDFYNKDGIRGNLTPEYINFAVDQSLKRLNRDRIDIYQIHSQKPSNIIDNNVFETLEKLKTNGKIRHYGISVHLIKDAHKILNQFEIDTLQIPYNLLNYKKAESLLEDEFINSVGIICREPLASGFLTGKYDIDSKFEKTDHRNGYSPEHLKEIVNYVNKFRFLEIEGRNLTQSSINFCLQSKKIGVVIPGIKNRTQLFENLESTNYEFTETELGKISLNSRLDLN